MNHELLLNTETPKIDNKPVVKPASSLETDKPESTSQRAFSSELNEQVSQQFNSKDEHVVPSNNRSDVATVVTGSDRKAEAKNKENGKPLPENGLGESTLGQAIAHIVKQVPPEDKGTVKEALLSVIEDFKNQAKGKGQATEVAPTENIPKLIEQFADIVAASPASQASKTIPEDGLQTDKPIQNINAVAASSDLEEIDSIQKQLLSSLGSITDNKADQFTDKAAVPQLVQQIKELTAQVKVIVANERLSNTENKNDLGKTIADWMKKIGELAKTASGQTVVTSDTDAKLKENILSTGQDTKELKIRPDILQALANKVAGDESKQGQTALGDKVIQKVTDQGSERAIERVTQLAGLIKPEKQESQSTNRTPNDKGRVPTFGPALINSAPLTTDTGPRTAATLDIQPALQSQAWSKVVGSRVIWMAKEGIQKASLQLNPANLGPVEVRLSVQNEQTNVMFIAQQAATRDALEQALPRLRESFAENGLDLADADVMEQFQGNDDSEQTDADPQNHGLNENNIAMAVDAVENGEVDELLNQQEGAVGLSVYA